MKSWAVRTCAGTDWNVTVEDGDRVTIKSESSNTRFNGNVESAITHLAIALAAQEETIEELFRGRVAELEAIGLTKVWLSVTQSITDIRRQWSVSAVNGTTTFTTVGEWQHVISRARTAVSLELTRPKPAPIACTCQCDECKRLREAVPAK